MTLIYLTIWSQTMHSWNLLQTSLLLQWMAKCLNWWTSHNSLQNSFIVNCIVFQTKEILGFWKLCHRLLKFHLDFQLPHRPSEDCHFHIIPRYQIWLWKRLECSIWHPFCSFSYSRVYSDRIRKTLLPTTTTSLSHHHSFFGSK